MASNLTKNQKAYVERAYAEEQIKKQRSKSKIMGKSNDDSYIVSKKPHTVTKVKKTKAESPASISSKTKLKSRGCK